MLMMMDDDAADDYADGGDNGDAAAAVADAAAAPEAMNVVSPAVFHPHCLPVAELEHADLTQNSAASGNCCCFPADTVSCCYCCCFPLSAVFHQLRCCFSPVS